MNLKAGCRVQAHNLRDLACCKRRTSGRLRGGAQSPLERRVQGLGFRVQGLGFGVQGLGFGVQGSGFEVLGVGFGV